MNATIAVDMNWSVVCGVVNSGQRQNLNQYISSVLALIFYFLLLVKTDHHSFSV